MEPVTIFTTVMSILTFVRTGIQIIYKDGVEWEEYGDYYSDLWDKLKELLACLEDWETRWMVWTGDHQLLGLFWPNKSHEPIIKKLKDVERRAKSLCVKLEDCDIHGKKATRIWKKGTNALLGRLSSIENRIARVQGAVKALESAANRAFCAQLSRQDWYRHSTLTDEEIEMLGYQSLLKRMTDASSESSTELFHKIHLSATNLEIPEIYLELGFFGPDVKCIDQRRLTPKFAEPISRNNGNRPVLLQSLALSLSTHDGDSCPDAQHKGWAHSPALRYTFISRDRLRPDIYERVRVTPAMIEPDRALCKITFHEAQRAVTDRSGLDSSGLAFRRGGTTLGVVREELDNIAADIPRPIQLRSIIDGTNPPVRDTALVLVLRLKLAFQLVEFVMLFLKTPWVRSICLCDVGRADVPLNKSLSDEELFRYTFLPHHPSQRWCPEREARTDTIPEMWANFPLFYLGLLLIEVGLDDIIVAVAVTEGQAPKPDVLELGLRSGGRHLLVDLQARFRDNCPHQTAQDAYYKAIVKCFQSQWESTTISPNQLTQYFDIILHP